MFKANCILITKMRSIQRVLQVKARLMYCLEELAFECFRCGLEWLMTFDGKMHAPIADFRLLLLFFLGNVVDMSLLRGETRVKGSVKNVPFILIKGHLKSERRKVSVAALSTLIMCASSFFKCILRSMRLFWVSICNKVAVFFNIYQLFACINYPLNS